MIKLIIPRRIKNKTYDKDFAYILWEKLGVTGNMQIIVPPFIDIYHTPGV